MNQRPQIIVTGGNTYLGTVFEKKGITTIIDAIGISNGKISSADIQKWYDKKTLGDLISVTIQGDAQFTVTNLNSRLETYFDICFKLMQDATDVAIPNLIVKEFLELCNSI